MDSTWAETVSRTQFDKLTNQPPPLAPSELAAGAAAAITRSKGHGRTTHFHPVTGQWTDPTREAAAQEHSQRDGIVRGNLARDRQLRHLQSYDFLTGRARVLEPPLPSGRPTTDSFSSRVPFNILSGQPLPDLLLTRAASNPRLAAAAQGCPARPLFNHAPSLVRRRAIDPLSGKYLQGDEARSAAEAAAALERSQRRFWQTRNFHPLLQRYEDSAKDALYQEAEAAAGAAAGVAQAARLPAAIRYSQGRAYDSVAHTPKDAEVLHLLDTMANRPLRRMGRLAVEERLSAEGEAEGHLAEVRRMNSQSTARAVHNSDPRGYGITSSAPTTAWQLRTGKPLSAWERIEADLAGGREGGEGGQGSSSFQPVPGYRAGQGSRGRRLEPLPGVGLGHMAFTVSGGGGGAQQPPPTPMRVPEGRQ